MEYISISQFAESVNVSKQAVYKAMNGKLKPYVKTENGKRVISADAIQLYNNHSQQVDNQVETMEKQLEALKKQHLEEVEELKAQLEEKQRLTTELTTAVNKLKEDSQLVEKLKEQHERQLEALKTQHFEEVEFLKKQIEQRDETIKGLTTTVNGLNANLMISQQMMSGKLLPMKDNTAEDKPKGIIRRVVEFLW